MKKYEFFDTDYTGHCDYDIAGDEYTKLMEVCCRYGHILSLCFTNAQVRLIDLADELEEFRITKPDNIDSSISNSGIFAMQKEAGSADSCNYNVNFIFKRNEIKYYRVCFNLKKLLIEKCNSIWQWIDGWGYHNPTNPTFYRYDGSIFFSSEIHDGRCTLMPRYDENVESIIKNQGWLQADN